MQSTLEFEAVVRRDFVVDLVDLDKRDSFMSFGHAFHGLDGYALTDGCAEPDESGVTDEALTYGEVTD
jgi:hypothetical protein